MKNFILLFFVCCLSISYGQNKKIVKPAYVVIANDEILSKKQFESYGERGYIKSMNKGVSKEERDRLAEKLGSKIGEKEFIVSIELFTKEEVLAKKKQSRSVTSKATKPQKKGDGFILRAGDTAADFKVQMVDGTELKLSDLTGKVVLLNFWATWCAPCLMEFYDMPEAILNPFKDQPFVFLPISIGESKEKVAKKIADLRKKGLDFSAGIDPENRIWNQYGAHGIPRNFLIDQNGVIRYVSAGYSEENLAAIAKEINTLLKKN